VSYRHRSKTRILAKASIQESANKNFHRFVVGLMVGASASIDPIADYIMDWFGKGIEHERKIFWFH